MSEPHRSSPPALALISAQLLLMLGVVYQFRLESRGFLHLMALVVVAFPIHALLPLGWRPKAFLGLSLTAIVVVLTPVPALFLLAIGIGLIGLCHLPLSWPLRYGSLALAGGALAWLRADPERTADLGLATLDSLWPILGSMFMFRLLVYLYDLRYANLEPSKIASLSYFFMLPNVCFPLFPVVDYKRFRKTYYSEAASKIYRRGARWMARGLVQLILYRFVYHHMALDPADVHGGPQLVQYMLAGFLLYLRVSGHFHLIVGMLLLFGFNLPTTHRQYFLASSLSDFWRRINIYWKDFMAKIFFFPSHDRLRRWGHRPALAMATGWVFAATWFLHAYQWFWITGEGLLTWSDVLFWWILGSLVVINVLWESRPGRAKATQRLSGERWARGLRIAATFIFLTVLWSLWTTDSLALWLHLWSTAPGLAPLLTALILGLLALAAWIAGKGKPLAKRTLRHDASAPRHLLAKDVVRCFALLALVALGRPQVQAEVVARLPESVASSAAQLGASLRSNELNRRDAAAQRQGYYEQLIAAPIDNPGLHHLYARRPADWRRIDETPAWRRADGWRHGELVPGAQIDFKRARLSINRWGMRDRDYPRQRTPGVPRLAVLGSSHTMGSGIADGENFESLLERRWNADVGPLEVLNFAVAGHSTMEDMVILEERVVEFGPDAILEVAHTHDLDKGVRFLARALAEGQAIDHPALAPILEASGALKGQARGVLEHRLRPHRWQLMAAVYGHMAQFCRERRIEPLWVLLPLVSEESSSDMDRLVHLAEEAGFTVFDLRHVYASAPARSLRLAPWDQHPNGKAHRLVAEQLFDSLRHDLDLSPAP